MKTKRTLIMAIILIVIIILLGIFFFQFINKPQEENFNSKIQEAKPAQFNTKQSAIDAIKKSYDVKNNKLVLYKEEKDSWIIDEMEETKIVERYRVYKTNGVINRIVIE